MGYKNKLTSEGQKNLIVVHSIGKYMKKMKRELPCFGYGKRVVLFLFLSVISWVSGLFYFGIDTSSKVCISWLISPLLCVLFLGIYSFVSISNSLLQFSNVSDGGARLAEDILRAKNNLSKRGFNLDD